MQSKISKAIQERIEKAISSRITSLHGVVEEYNYASCLATVSTTFPGASCVSRIGYVPVRTSFGGLVEGQPKQGDQCIIEFENGDLTAPYITMILDEDQTEKIRSRQDRENSGSKLPLSFADWKSKPVAERYIEDPDNSFESLFKGVF